MGFAYYAYHLLVTAGYFIHQWDITVRHMIDILYVSPPWISLMGKGRTLIRVHQILHVGGVLYSISLPLIKASILLEWSRIFVPMGTRNAFWWICNILVVLQLSFMVAIVFALCFACVPYQKIWDLTTPGTCLDKTRIEIASAGINLGADIIILALPQKVIWSLQMGIKRKIGVSVVFSLGVLYVKPLEVLRVYTWVANI